MTQWEGFHYFLLKVSLQSSNFQYQDGFSDSLALVLISSNYALIYPDPILCNSSFVVVFIPFKYTYMAVTPYSFPFPRASWLTQAKSGRGNSATPPQLPVTSVFSTLCRECHLISFSSRIRLSRPLSIHQKWCGYPETTDCV